MGTGLFVARPRTWHQSEFLVQENRNFESDTKASLPDSRRLSSTLPEPIGGESREISTQNSNQREPVYEDGVRMLPSFAQLCACFPVLNSRCQPDYLAQNNALIKRDFRWRKIYEVLAARIRKLITARARKNKRTTRMFANARKDHSITLIIALPGVSLTKNGTWLI